MKLYDLATVVRSKNAGPFLLTVDLFFQGDSDMDRVLRSPGFCCEGIALLYGVPAQEVHIRPFARVHAIKVTLPRRVSSGAPGDGDVYGCQQHFPLAGLEVEDVR